MSEVEDNLASPTKDKFTQRLLNTKREINSAQITVFIPPGAPWMA
jgi:hypothetical protein